MSLPDRMRFVDLPVPGGPDAMTLAEGPLPAFGPGDILIRVEAAGVNRPDVLQRLGRYPVPPGASPVMGLEVAGEVVAMGDAVTGRSIGDRVTALANGGGYAQYCAVPATQALPWPEGYDAVRAAALPETLFTVWANLFDMGGLSPDETVLVHGGSSGIGTTAIGLAKALGARVVVTAGTAEKCKACRALGADHAINYRSEDFVGAVSEYTGGAGVDVVLDMVGGPYFSRNVGCLKKDGRLVIIAFLGGSKADEVDLAPIMINRLRVTGSTMRPRTTAEKAAIAERLRERVWPLLDAGACGPVIYRDFEFDEVAEAHRLMEEGRHIGKIVLRLV